MPRYIHHLSRNTRSIRRFRESYPVTEKLMSEWVDNARLTASAKNLQPLKYHLVTGKEECAKVFETCAWAGYLTDWDGPVEGERPTGFIVMACDTAIAKPNQACFDAGIAAQTILMGAVEEGFGGCIIQSFKKSALEDAVSFPEGLEPMFVIALGKPIEDVRLVEMENNSHEYYRDENKVHFVPKRSLEEVLF